MQGLRLFHSGMIAARIVFAVLGLNAATVPVLGAEEEAVRPELGKPLKAAQELLSQHKYREALARLEQAESIGGKSPYETYVTDWMRALAARGAGETATAIKAYEAAAATGRLSPEDRLHFVAGVAIDYFNAKDYAKAVQWAERYSREGGADRQIATVIVDSYFFSNDFAKAADAVRAQIAAAERENRAPTENQLIILSECAQKLNDQAGYRAALEKLVSAYPKKAYWETLLIAVRKNPAFAGRLELDFLRLRQATGTMDSPDEYVTMAQLALEAALPGEARKTVEQGYAAGILGRGGDAARNNRLREMVTKAANEDRPTLDRSVAEAAAQKSGMGLVNTGLDYVGYGEFDRGLPLIEQGIAKGSLKHPEDARLHLGMACFLAGRKARAAELLQAVQGADGTADLARLWIILARQTAHA
jgi:hypothetical protein